MLKRGGGSGSMGTSQILLGVLWYKKEHFMLITYKLQSNLFVSRYNSFHSYFVVNTVSITNFICTLISRTSHKIQLLDMDASYKTKNIHVKKVHATYLKIYYTYFRFLTFSFLLSFNSFFIQICSTEQILINY